MEKIKLKVGDVFNFTKVSYLYYKILELDRASNYAKIELICPYDVDNWDEDWKPNWSDPSEYKYFIVYNSNIYKVDYNWTSIYDRIYFKNKKDAQAVIDNPNFRNILDAIYKN